MSEACPILTIFLISSKILARYSHKLCPNKKKRVIQIHLFPSLRKKSDVLIKEIGCR